MASPCQTYGRIAQRISFNWRSDSDMHCTSASSAGANVLVFYMEHFAPSYRKKERDWNQAINRRKCSFGESVFPVKSHPTSYTMLCTKSNAWYLNSHLIRLCVSHGNKAYATGEAKVHSFDAPINWKQSFARLS